MGRPRGTGKFTEALAKEIVLWVQGGNYLEDAAKASDIDKDTLFEWLREGRRDRRRGRDTPLARFSGAVEKAEAAADCRDVSHIHLAGKRDWRAAAWRLSHKNPEKWGGRERGEEDDVKAAATLVDGLAQFLGLAWQAAKEGAGPGRAGAGIPRTLGGRPSPLRLGGLRGEGVDPAGGDPDGPDQE